MKLEDIVYSAPSGIYHYRLVKGALEARRIDTEGLVKSDWFRYPAGFEDLRAFKQVKERIYDLYFDRLLKKI